MLTRTQSLRRIWSADDQDHTALVVEFCTKHLRQFPKDCPVLVQYGMTLVILHRYAEAEKALRQAMAFCPKEKKQLSFAQMGHLFQAKGEFKKARLWYKRAARLDPKDATYHILLGANEFKQGRLKQAEQHFRRATKCSEGSVDEAYFNLGGIMLAHRRYADAAICYRKALKIDPKDAIAALRLKDAKLALAELNSK